MVIRMSAYLVDRDTIRYLVSAATSRQIMHNYTMRWHHSGQSHELRCGEPKPAADVGQMLWSENYRSVEHRYPDITPDTMPGPVDDLPIYYEHITWQGNIDPVQVLKTCANYSYQSCETSDWKETEAHAFIEALTHHAIRALPGYEDAAWGAPRESFGLTRER